MEFINPKKTLSCLDSLPNLHNLIQSDVVVCHDFKIVHKRFFDELKEIENSKAKAYCCIVWVKKRITAKELQSSINSCSNLTVKQTTPIRVLHRRSLMVRDKLIYKLKVLFFLTAF